MKQWIIAFILKIQTRAATQITKSRPGHTQKKRCQVVIAEGNSMLGTWLIMFIKKVKSSRQDSFFVIILTIIMHT